MKQKRKDDSEIQDWVKQVQEFQSEEAFAALYQEFKYLLYAVLSRQLRMWPDSFDHLKSDILSVFWELIIKYDKTRTTTFRRYISSALFWYVENLKNKMFPSTKTLISFEKTGQFEVSLKSKKPILRGILLEELLDNTLTSIKGRFPVYKYPFHSKLFCAYYLKGFTQMEIAKRYGHSQTFVSLSLKEMRTWVRLDSFLIGED